MIPHHSFIAPIEYLDLIPKSCDFHLVLAGLLKDERYASFYRKRKRDGDFIIIDNMAFEHKTPLPVEEYYKLVNDSGIIPDVVVAPDYPFQAWDKTVASTIKFIKEYGNYFDANVTSVMAVPQSIKGDYKGWIKAYSEFSVIEEIEYVGMSILGIPNAFCGLTGTNSISFNRTFASMYLMNNRIISPDKKHHYLGCDDIRELLLQKEIGVIYSNDSSSAFWHGIEGRRFDNSYGGLIGGKSKESVDFEIGFNDDRVEDIQYNIKWIEDMLMDK